MSNSLMNTYASLPVAFTRGEGAWLWDENGRRYLDGVSGLGVCSLGHAHPEVTRVIAEQAGTLLHTGNLVRIPWQERLAERLADVTGLERSFICNSGTEAIECALKIVRIIGHGKGHDLPGVVVMEHSFHGRTLAALSATGSRKAQAGFEPLVGGFVRAPYGDLEALGAIASRRSDICAVLVEPIQGEAGIRVPPPGFLAGLRTLCNRNGWLMIVDEIQAGLCRTGKWFSHQHEDVTPDILTTAKALGNGLPIGACVARGAAGEAFTPGRHGSTFGGNPLGSRVACTVLDIMRDEDLAGRAATIGEAMLASFRRRLGDHPSVREVRGKGLMIGIQLDREAGQLKQAALDEGLLLNVTQESVIRLLPPLIIDDAQAEQIIETVCSLVESFG